VTVGEQRDLHVRSRLEQFAQVFKGGYAVVLVPVVEVGHHDIDIGCGDLFEGFVQARCNHFDLDTGRVFENSLEPVANRCACIADTDADRFVYRLGFRVSLVACQATGLYVIFLAKISINYITTSHS
jgi:hypothetical protein